MYKCTIRHPYLKFDNRKWVEIMSFIQLNNFHLYNNSNMYLHIIEPNISFLQATFSLNKCV